MMYAILTILNDKKRYIAGMLAVTFSAVLIAMQVGLLMGLIGVVSVPIVHSKADIWISFPDTPACDLGRPMPNYWLDRLWSHPDIAAADEFVQGFRYWQTEKGKNELCVVLGVSLDDESLGPIARLTPEQRSRLTEPNAVILDAKDAGRLDATQIGVEGEITGQRVRVVGFTDQMRGITGPFIVTSIPTARRLLLMRDDQATFLLAKCKDPARIPAVVADLSSWDKWTVHSAKEFSSQSEWHWIGKTKAGIALGFAAVLGLAIGCSITSQTLYAAIGASIRELAVLRALGISRGRMVIFVLQQSMVVGIVGLLLAIPITYGLLTLVRSLGTQAVMPIWLITGTGSLTLAMAIIAGLFSLRSLKGVEPAELLR
ncbi:ABC transporter permease [bacterium]|jgi:putative ABC transport system permease protein|nr:ABC transporter permease [bacterium]